MEVPLADLVDNIYRRAMSTSTKFGYQRRQLTSVTLQGSGYFGLCLKLNMRRQVSDNKELESEPAHGNESSTAEAPSTSADTVELENLLVRSVVYI